jgi:hypothetical protein
MKKLICYFFVCIFLIGLNMPCKAWGIHKFYEHEYENFLMRKILNGENIVYYLQDYRKIEPFVANSKNKNVITAQNVNKEISESFRDEETKNNILGALKFFLTETRSAIVNSGRQNQFSDIMPYFSKKINLSRTFNKKNADLIVFIYDKSDKIETGHAPHSIIKLFSNTKKDFIYMLGNDLGLVPYEADTSLTYSANLDRNMYNSSYSHLTCDGVDGVINLIHLTSYLEKKKFPSSARSKWSSFCNGKKNDKGKTYKKTYYKEAKPVSVDDWYTEDSAGKGFGYKRDKNGNIVDSFHIDPFAFKNKKTYNSNGLIATLEADKKDEGYDSYSYTYKKQGNTPTICITGHPGEGEECIQQKLESGNIRVWNYMDSLKIFINPKSQVCTINTYASHNSKPAIYQFHNNTNTLLTHIYYMRDYYIANKGTQRNQPSDLLVKRQHPSSLVSSCKIYTDGAIEILEDISLPKKDPVIEIKYHTDGPAIKVPFKGNLTPILDQYAIDEKTFIEDAKKACKEPVPQAEYYQNICSFFVKADGYFNR